MDNIIENVIIIGSGPAGHTAAIYTARAKLKPLMFEGFSASGIPGGQLMITTEVENYPGFPNGITGPKLMEHFKKQSTSFGTRILTQDVQSVDLTQTPLKLISNNKNYFSHSIIIATGASAKHLGLQNEQRLLNHGVSLCATCDGALPLFRNKDIVVVGGGDSAMEEALFLTRFANKIYLVHRRKEFRSSKIMLERVKNHEKIELCVPFTIQDICGDTCVQSVILKNTQNNEEKKLPVSGVFVAIGHTPNTSIFKDQIALENTGYIKTHPNSTHTSVEGVFACGDVQDHTYRQAITAAGSGCMAALDCEKWLEL